MDLRKTGKLIAKLRNEKGLTQQELGDIIGVGFRAVSKWERGLNLPDIGNINELSKLFGISSDEILNGELKEEEIPKETIEETTPEVSIEQNIKKKIPLTIKIIILLITVLILIVTTLIIYNNNKVYVYDMQSINEDEYYVKGEITLQEDQISIILERFQIKDIQFSLTSITNYQYEITSGEQLIFGYGENLEENITNQSHPINDLGDVFKINYNGETTITKEELETNHFYIKITLWDNNSKEITKNIKILLFQE